MSVSLILPFIIVTGEDELFSDLVTYFVLAFI